MEVAVELILFHKTGLATENYGESANFTINIHKVTMNDAINSLSTSASLCSEACSTPMDNNQGLTQDVSMEVKVEDEAKAGNTSSKEAGVAKLDPLKGDKSGLASFQQGSTSDEVAKPMPCLAYRWMLPLT